MSAPLTELFEEHTQINVGVEDGVYFIPSADRDRAYLLKRVGTIMVSEPIMGLIDAERGRIRVTLHEFVEGCYVEICHVDGLYRLRPK